MSEMIDIYELKQDKLMHIGIMDKKEAEKKGKLHKVSRVYPVKNINGEWCTILQRRGRDKKIGALNFAIAVSEHVKAGENNVDACVRGIKEELGLDIRKEVLKEAYDINFKFDKGDIKERTYCTTYIFESELNINGLILEKEEVEGIYIVSINKMTELFNVKCDVIEASGLNLDIEGKEYIEGKVKIKINNFTDYEFYKEDFIKLSTYLKNINA